MRLLHTMLRVGDLNRSIAFYTEVLGMQLLRRSENPDYRSSLAFIGFDGGNPGQAEIELTHNWDQAEPYAQGTAWGHIAIAVSDIHAVCADLAEWGVNIVRAPGPMKHSPTRISFIEDPDSYKIQRS